ncbi:MAG: hypothetical protein ACK4GT_03935 [Pararhodobacter sp.]
MADFLRPPARAFIARWTETGGALALTFLGLWWAFSGPGPIYWLGWIPALLGAGLTVGAVQRARFASRGAGSGVVEVIEGEIRYFGPRGGGIVPLDGMLTLSISSDAEYWLIEAAEGQILVIPRAAAGHPALFDAFGALPGFDMQRLLRLVAQGPSTRVQIIWQHPARRLLT